jgi:AcrR family transcriptional regulator
MCPRPYHQTRRAEAAEATRSRIVAAARDQLLDGAELFTIEAVARRAGVARVTVYAQVGNRDQLREAVFDDLAATGGLGELPGAFTMADPLDGLRRLVEIFCTFYARHRTVLRRLRALAVLDPGDVARHHDRNAGRRMAITVLLSRAGLAGSIDDLSDTISLFQALTSFEFFEQLAGETDVPSAVAGRVWTVMEAVLHQ